MFHKIGNTFFSFDYYVCMKNVWKLLHDDKKNGIKFKNYQYDIVLKKKYGKRRDAAWKLQKKAELKKAKCNKK